MVQTLWDSITQSITGAPSDDDIRRRREDESAFASLYDAARQRDAPRIVLGPYGQHAGARAGREGATNPPAEVIAGMGRIEQG